uniref:P1 family peptidase n=1 Tax=Pararhizobium sp. IMCC3301 TaxID=3067904 RepID=UPI0027403CE1|nr:P1 family peptidase [Pararhizobium sp. IMCC3301]
MKSALDTLLIGHADDSAIRSGVTVLLCQRPMLAAVHVMGAAPGTRETELLAPENTVSHIDAIVLSGGSAFGLDAAGGVVEVLRQQGRGFRAGDQTIPIVPAAILFDLGNGGKKDWHGPSPYTALGRAAINSAAETFQIGGVGAGFGATTANLRGGFGYTETRLADGVLVCAFVAVNAVGQVTMGEGPHFWAAPFERDSEFGGRGAPNLTPDIANVRVKTLQKRALTAVENTTIGVIATNATLTKGQAKRLAISAHDGYARAIWPCHTPMDGDVVFALSSEERPATDQLLLNAASASTMARAIAIAVYATAPRKDDTLPSWQAKFGA